MAITARILVGFETGGLEEVAPNPNGTIETVPAPWSSKETYCCFVREAFGAKGKVDTQAVTITQGHWITFGLYVRFNFSTLNNDFNFLELRRGGLDMALKVDVSTGDLVLLDSNSAAQGTDSSTFVNDQWYLVSGKFIQDSPTGSAKIWIQDAGSGSRRLVFDKTNLDLTSSSGNTFMRFGQSFVGGQVETKYYVGSAYLFSDDGGTIDTNDTVLGNYTVLRYQENSQSGTSDFGNNLDRNRWDNAADTPGDDNTSADYKIDLFSTTKSGGLTDNVGTGAGPAGDANVDGTIKAASWIWRIRKDTGGGIRMKAWGKYGSTAVNDPSTDHTTLKGFGELFTSWINAMAVTNNTVSPGAMPGPNDYFQIGFRADKIGFGVTNYARLGDCWCCLLHEEPVSLRTVILDGVMQRVP